MEQRILSVSQINQYIQSLMDNDMQLMSVAIRGEISNYKVYPSGHHYFTIKDELSALRCVMFRGNTARLKFRPESGMQVIAFGKITVYPRDGAYQLYCSSLSLDGIGDLYVAFEQLKKKLSAQGMFDPAHKKPIPQYPGVIGVITSSAGAAIHDILRVLSKRYPLAHVRLLPVRVQGAEAPEEISNAIAYANAHHLADLLIVGRGGGSIEDLWAFNDERVAKAIYDSQIPVISAVGHEPDVTISDFVADLRAATPSNAAELAVPEQNALQQSLDAYITTIGGLVLRKYREAQQKYKALAMSAVLTDPYKSVHLRRDKLAFVTAKLQGNYQRTVSYQREMFSALTAKLDAMSPLKVLARGYSMVQTDDQKIVRTIQQINNGDVINITFSDGSAVARITETKELSK